MDNLFATLWLILQTTIGGSPDIGPQPTPPPPQEIQSQATAGKTEVAKTLSCALEHKGNDFVAIIEADASYAIAYELKLQSTGNNVMRLTRRDAFDVQPGSNRKELSANVRVSGQKVTGDLTLSAADHPDVHCTNK